MSTTMNTIGKEIPGQALRFQKVGTPRFRDNRHMKVYVSVF